MKGFSCRCSIHAHVRARSAPKNASVTHPTTNIVAFVQKNAAAAKKRAGWRCRTWAGRAGEYRRTDGESSRLSTQRGAFTIVRVTRSDDVFSDNVSSTSTVPDGAATFWPHYDRRARFFGALRRAEVFLLEALFAAAFFLWARRSAKSMGAPPAALLTTTSFERLFRSIAIRSMIFAPPSAASGSASSSPVRWMTLFSSFCFAYTNSFRASASSSLSSVMSNSRRVNSSISFAS